MGQIRISLFCPGGRLTFLFLEFCFKFSACSHMHTHARTCTHMNAHARTSYIRWNPCDRASAEMTWIKSETLCRSISAEIGENQGWRSALYQKAQVRPWPRLLRLWDKLFACWYKLLPSANDQRHWSLKSNPAFRLLFGLPLLNHTIIQTPTHTHMHTHTMTPD